MPKSSQKALQCLDNMSQRDVFIWNMMIQAYANLGFGNEALVVFKEMCGEGLGVDKFTYMFVLKACSVGSDVIMGRAFHGRVVKCLVTKGREIFKQMEDYGVEKGHEHYACMVDLYGRAGLLTEAFEFIESMPILPTKDVYNIEIAEVVAQKLLWIISMDDSNEVVNLGFGDGGGRRVWRGKWDPLVGGRVEKLVVGRRRYGGMMVEEEVE
ncbi:pentatricopeptide repeat-containing protein [Tanacetum coccineum]|uniref:Pentatricopeptide repeat-containing protein n=1 Tax=Tanacetum coccineum TaxID=301880 RepID=A0ABQ5DFQ3_9ASTR